LHSNEDPVQPEIKLLKKKKKSIGVKLHDLGSGNGFPKYEYDTKITSNKRKK